MQRFRDNILIMGSNGLIPYSGSTVAVYLAGTSTLASIYPSNDPASAKENPFRAGDYGEIDFYAKNGRYDLLLSRQGYQSLRITDLQMWDPANSDFVTGVDVDGMIAGKADIAYVNQEVAGLIDDVTPAEDKTYSSQKVFTDLAAKVSSADLADDTDPDKGAAGVGYLLDAAGAVGRTQAEKNADTVSVKDFGAIGDGMTDDTAAIQLAIDSTELSGHSLYFPPGTYIVSSLKVKGRGRVIYGAGKRKTIISSPNGSYEIIQWGDASVNGNGYCDHGALRDMSIYGNPSSTGGLIVKGSVDDNPSWSVASRYNTFSDLHVINVGNGPSVRLSAWGNKFINVETWSGLRGLEIGNESHSAGFFGFTSSSHTKEALKIPSGVYSSGISFMNCVMQLCGGDDAMIDIAGADRISFVDLYTEGLSGPSKKVMRIARSGVSVLGMRWSRANSPFTDADIVCVEGSVTATVKDVFAWSDCNSILRISGELPRVDFSNITPLSGASNHLILDESARKASFGYNSGNARGVLPRTIVTSLPSDKAFDFVDSSTGLSTLAIYGSGAVAPGVSNVTISDGAITVTGGYLAIDTEGFAETDDLDSISGGWADQILILRAAHADRTVVVKRQAGNIYLSGPDFSLTHTYDRLVLQRHGAAWVELFRSDNQS